MLKCLNASSDMQHITRTMNLINTMDEPMDEVLLSSVVEACVRIGKPELLSARLEMLKDSSGTVCGAHTFGSLIKAYGHAKDIDGVWRCWKEMRSRHIRPTSITIGCMVEAVVSNGDTEGGFELIHQMQDDEQCHDVLNSIIYCSVLKGFTREKKMDRALAVYEEISSRNIELSVGPMKMMPSFSSARGSAGFSEAWPQPGHTASTLYSLATSTMMSTLA